MDHLSPSCREAFLGGFSKRSRVFYFWVGCRVREEAVFGNHLTHAFEYEKTVAKVDQPWGKKSFLISPCPTHKGCPSQLSGQGSQPAFVYHQGPYLTIKVGNVEPWWWFDKPEQALGVVSGGGCGQRQGREGENIGHFGPFSVPVVVVVLYDAHGIDPQIAETGFSCEYDCILESRRKGGEDYIPLPCFEVS